MGKWSRVNNVRQKVDLSVDPFAGTPPKGMVPSSIPGLYTTPEVIEPNDCDNYPDSPFCGGNPINNTPLDAEISINVDQCGVSAKIGVTIGYFKFPQHGAAYVKPECRNEPPPYRNAPFTKELSPRQELNGFNRNIPDSENVYVGVTQSGGEYTSFTCGLNKPPGRGWLSRFSEGIKLRYGYIGETYQTFGNETVSLEAYAEAIVVDKDYNSSVICGNTSGSDHTESTPFIVDIRINTVNDPRVYIYEITNNGDVYRITTVGGQTIQTNTQYNQPPFSTFKWISWTFSSELQLAYGKWEVIRRYYQRLYQKLVEEEGNSPFILVIDCFDVLRPEEIPNHKYNTYKDTFNTKDKCNCMGCCSPSPYEQAKEKERQRKQDQCCEELKKLLKEIKVVLGSGKPKIEYYDVDPSKSEAQKKTVVPKDLTLAIEELSKLHKITQQAIGVDEYPIQYPDSIVEPINDNILEHVWDFITPDKTRKITSLAQMLDWMVDQQSATIGKLQRQIQEEVEDNKVQADGSIKKGTKKVSVVLPDLATAIEEIYKMQIQIFKALGMNTDIGLKNLQENVHSSVLDAELVQRVKSIEQFLSFPIEQKSTELPIQITVPTKGSEKDVEKDLLKYLQPSKTQIIWDDFDGSQTLYEMLTDLLNAAAIIRAVYYGRS